MVLDENANNLTYLNGNTLALNFADECSAERVVRSRLLAKGAVSWRALLEPIRASLISCKHPAK